MNVNALLLAREEEQSELAVTDDGWSHERNVADSPFHPSRYSANGSGA